MPATIMTTHEDREYDWSEGSYELAGVCGCGDFSCESSSTGRCVNSEA